MSQNWSERSRVYAGDLSKIEGYHQYSFDNFELTKSSYDLGVSGQLEAGDVLTINGTSGQSIVLTVPNLYAYKFKGSFKDGESFSVWGAEMVLPTSTFPISALILTVATVPHQLGLRRRLPHLLRMFGIIRSKTLATATTTQMQRI